MFLSCTALVLSVVFVVCFSPIVDLNFSLTFSNFILLTDFVESFKGDSPQAKAIANQLKAKLNELKDLMQSALTDKVGVQIASTILI